MKTRRFNAVRFSVDLRECRTARGLTLRELEGICGISNSFLNQVEKGVTAVGVDNLVWLCDWMGRTLDHYMEVVGQPEPISVVEISMEVTPSQLDTVEKILTFHRITFTVRTGIAMRTPSVGSSARYSETL